MDIATILKDNSILLVPNNIKIKILKEINKLKEIYNIKIMSKEEFISNATFTYDKKTIYYLINNYNLKYENALVYLDNIRYIEDKKYNNLKLDKLVQIKNELINNNLLKFNENFINYAKSKNIVIYGYDYLDKYSLKILKDYNYEYVEKNAENYSHSIYEFNDIEDEVNFVATQIIDLLKNNINIKNIKIINYTDEYKNILKRIFNFYNLKINDNHSNIYDTRIIKTFLDNISNENVLDFLKEKFDFTKEENNYIYNKLINILNEYTFIDNYSSIKSMLIYDFKHTSNYSLNFENQIELISLEDNIITAENYVFLLGFNQQNYPKIYKDEAYLSNQENIILDLDTTYDMNKISKSNTLQNIKNISNLTITYKLNSYSNEYQPSYLLDELKFKIIKDIKIPNNYSNKINKFKLTNMLDDLVKYGKNNDELSLYFNTYSNLEYLNFDNKFKGINKEDLNKFLNNKLSLSYSSIDNYFKCGFKYYLENVLCLNKFEDKLNQKIGNVFHEILSLCFNDDFDLDKEYENILNKLDLNSKEKFYFANLKGELGFIIYNLKEQEKYSSLNKKMLEKRFFVNKDGDVKVCFTGVIDKILYKEENGTLYVAIVDYKTGNNVQIDLNGIQYGLNMQLPVYIYLVKNSKEFKNVKIVGFYLQKLFDKDSKLLLEGYSNDDFDTISKLDVEYQDSKVIKSLKLKKDGTYYDTAKVLTDSEIDELLKQVTEKIDEAINDILNAKFVINPKKIKNDNIGCMYCKYKDICYMKNNDIVTLEDSDISKED